MIPKEQWKVARDGCKHQNAVCIDCGLNARETEDGHRCEHLDRVSWEECAQCFKKFDKGTSDKDTRMKVYAWLGYWRDTLPTDPVMALQKILGEL